MHNEGVFGRARPWTDLEPPMTPSAGHSSVSFYSGRAEGAAMPFLLRPKPVKPAAMRSLVGMTRLARSRLFTHCTS
jgi:hypothetical protein